MSSGSHTFGDGRSLADPLSRWRDDTGAAEELLEAALAAGDSNHVVTSLKSGRVFIALAPSTMNPDITEKTSDMSVVCITSNDGRIGLLAFTSVASLANWNPQARLIPITGPDAATAALDEGAQALILDPAGPVPFTVTLPDLVELAGTDQRHRAVGVLQEILDQEGINSATIELSDEGPLIVTVDQIDLDKAHQLIASRSDVHAYVPLGVGLTTR